MKGCGVRNAGTDTRCCARDQDNTWATVGCDAKVITVHLSIHQSKHFTQLLFNVSTCSGLSHALGKVLKSIDVKMFAIIQAIIGAEF